MKKIKKVLTIYIVFGIVLFVVKTCASGSAVEHLLAKEGVAGSIPVSRSQEKIRDIGRYLLFFSRSRGDLEPGVRSHPPKVGFGRFDGKKVHRTFSDSVSPRLALRLGMEK